MRCIGKSRNRGRRTRLRRSSEPGLDRTSLRPTTRSGHRLRLELDPGEAEAIDLAIENKSDLLLIDERRRRHIAARFDLKTLGLLGVLVEARRKGLIPSVSPLLNELSRAAGFYMTPELINRVKAACGET